MVQDPFTATGHFVACGKIGKCSEDEEVVPDGSSHEVRCCSNDEKPNYQQKNSQLNTVVPICPYSASKIGSNDICHSSKTYDEALEICVSDGARLCTANELLAGCSRGTGCGHDLDLIWSSDASDPTISSS